LSAAFPEYAPLLDKPCGPLGGDNDTPFATGYIARLGMRATYAALSRYVFDVGAWDNCQWIVFHGASGHTGSPFDGGWALGRPDLVEDFGHRAIHVMTVTANGSSIVVTASISDDIAVAYRKKPKLVEVEEPRPPEFSDDALALAERRVGQGVAHDDGPLGLDHLTHDAVGCAVAPEQMHVVAVHDFRPPVDDDVVVGDGHGWIMALDAHRSPANERCRAGGLNAQSLIESAERRLRLWNIADEQIAKIEQTRHAEESLPILAKMDGIVQTLPVTQGMTIAPGNTLVDVADLSVVWVWGEFYQEELPMLKVGQKVTVTSDSYPGERFKGQLSLVDPFIDDVKRTGRVRLDIQNPELKLKPDMYVDVLLEMNMGKSLVVPVSAIMPTGKHNIAFVDKGEGKLEPRFLELGGKYGNVYAVKSGLKEGERVVASANFLIDAESKIQGALKSW
jgi:RND family efflux transporter MFP subunit